MKAGGGNAAAYLIEMETASRKVSRFWTFEDVSQPPGAVFLDAKTNLYVDIGVPVRIAADGSGIRAMAARTSSGKWPGKWLAVDPRDGSLYLGGDRNTNTGREPYRQPFLYRFDGEGNKLSTLWEPAPREIGSGPGGGHLESDSSIRGVTWDRDCGKMIVAGWSDGGNTVFGRQATNWHVSAGARIGMGMDFSGMKSANSLASIMILNVETRSTDGVMSWASYVPSWFQDAKYRGAPNAANIEDIVVLSNGSVAVSGKAATGLIQTPNAFWKDPMTGEKHGGLYVAVFRPDFSSLMFSSYLPGYETAVLCPLEDGLLVCGRTKGADEAIPPTSSPAVQAVQAALGGNRDGHVVLLRFPDHDR
jgi:hypothetical protein